MIVFYSVGAGDARPGQERHQADFGGQTGKGNVWHYRDVLIGLINPNVSAFQDSALRFQRLHSLSFSLSYFVFYLLPSYLNCNCALVSESHTSLQQRNLLTCYSMRLFF